MVAYIEKSNPGIDIEARPSLVGKLNIMKERRESTAGLTVLSEDSQYLKEMLRKDEPKMLVSGRKRICRVWRELTKTTICNRYCTVRHNTPRV